MQDTTEPGSIRDLFRDRGLTEEAVAVLGGVDTSTVSRLINGKTRARPETIVHLARALGISARRLQAMADAAREAADAAAVSS